MLKKELEEKQTLMDNLSEKCKIVISGSKGHFGSHISGQNIEQQVEHLIDRYIW